MELEEWGSTNLHFIQKDELYYGFNDLFDKVN